MVTLYITEIPISNETTDIGSPSSVGRIERRPVVRGAGGAQVVVGGIALA